MNEDSAKTLSQAIDEYKKILSDDEKAYAILYTPRACHLALVDKTGKFFNEDGEFAPHSVFEARIFNEKAELRWLNESDGKGKMAIIDASFPDSVCTIPQAYLLWGQSTGEVKGNWTEFATARVGSFYVPLPTVPNRGYARITAVEYLKECEDGNVDVVDERLTGIKPYSIEQEENPNG